MEKWLYLTKPEWTDAWVNGGPVPLHAASTYLSPKRMHTLTPDENLIDNSTHDIKNYHGLINIEGRGHSTISIGKLTVGGVEVASNMKFDRKYEDGLVFCVSNRRSNYIAKKMKKFACVRIVDIIALKLALDEQIGQESEIGKCTYTKTHHRHHFLKSHEDLWQDEFRLIWPGQEARQVEIPKGTAVPERIRCRG